MSPQSGSVEAIERFAERVNLIGLIDHGGRAGSNFVQCLFDTHEQVLVCPLVHYFYSYWRGAFGDATSASSSEVRPFLCDRSYFRLIYHDPTGHYGQLIRKIGGADKFNFDRATFRRLIEEFLAHRNEVSRRDLFAFAMGAYGVARGRDLGRVRYIMNTDAVSMASEAMLRGFDGYVIDMMVADFPQAWMIALVRDPRAQFASTRHQMVNELGNNYGVRWGATWKQLWSLIRDQLSMELGPAHLSLCYQVSAARTLFKKMEQFPQRFLVLQNEAINTDFLPTMQRLCGQLGVGIDERWKDPDYAATMMGEPWAGTGAYSSRYQTNEQGPLANDANQTSLAMARPNAYVTERWRKRMSADEIAMLEFLFREELAAFGYTFFERGDRWSRQDFLRHLPAGAAGEVPNWGWLKAGFSLGVKEAAGRLFYALVFPAFYLLARYKLARYALKDRFFENVCGQPMRVAFIGLGARNQ